MTDHQPSDPASPAPTGVSWATFMNPVAVSALIGALATLFNTVAHIAGSPFTITDSQSALLSTQITGFITILATFGVIGGHAWNHRNDPPKGK